MYYIVNNSNLNLGSHGVAYPKRCSILFGFQSSARVHGFKSTDVVDSFIRPLIKYCSFRCKRIEQRIYNQFTGKGGRDGHRDYASWTQTPPPF